MITRELQIQDILQQCKNQFAKIDAAMIFGPRAIDVSTYRVAILSFIHILEKYQSKQIDNEHLFYQVEEFLQKMNGVSFLNSPIFSELANKILDIFKTKTIWNESYMKLEESCNHQIILNYTFDEDNHAKNNHRGDESLKKKWNLTHKNLCGEILNPTDLQHILKGEKSFSIRKNMKTKITILAHTFPGANHISYLEGVPPNQMIKKIRFNELGDILIKLIAENDVVINLVSCYAGRGINDCPYKQLQHSFASKLHQYLLKKLEGRSIPIIARTHQVTIKSPMGYKTTRDLNYTPQEVIANENKVPRIRKQPGSKVIFITNDQNQSIVIDAYTLRWKKEVLQALNNLQSSANSSQKNLFNTWLTTFKNQDSQTILGCLQVEINNPHSILNNTQWALIDLFQPNPEKIIKDLVQKGESIHNHAAPTIKFTKKINK